MLVTPGMHRSRTLLTNQISAHHCCHLLSPSSVYQEIIQPSNRCQLEPMGALGLIIPNTLFDWAYLEHNTVVGRTGTVVAVDSTLVFIDEHSTVTGREWQARACWCAHTYTHRDADCFHALAFLETYPIPVNPDLHLDLDVALANEIYKMEFLILICQGFLVS